MKATENKTATKPQKKLTLDQKRGILTATQKRLTSIQDILNHNNKILIKLIEKEAKEKKAKDAKKSGETKEKDTKKSGETKEKEVKKNIGIKEEIDKITKIIKELHAKKKLEEKALTKAKRALDINVININDAFELLIDEAAYLIKTVSSHEKVGSAITEKGLNFINHLIINSERLTKTETSRFQYKTLFVPFLSYESAYSKDIISIIGSIFNLFSEGNGDKLLITKLKEIHKNSPLITSYKLFFNTVKSIDSKKKQTFVINEVFGVLATYDNIITKTKEKNKTYALPEVKAGGLYFTFEQLKEVTKRKETTMDNSKKIKSLFNKLGGKFKASELEITLDNFEEIKKEIEKVLMEAIEDTLKTKKEAAAKVA